MILCYNCEKINTCYLENRINGQAVICMLLYVLKLISQTSAQKENSHRLETIWQHT